MNETHLHQGKIILPNEMRLKQAKPQQVEVQVPIFPIPVRSKESFLMYALCAQATESGLYAEMPEILSQLTTMRQGLEAAYLKLAIPLYEYRQFVTKKDDNASSPPNQATNLEEVLVRANITWEALLNLVNQRVNTEFGFQKSVLLPSTPTPKVLVEGNKKSELTTAFIEGGEENAEMGTQKQEKE